MSFSRPGRPAPAPAAFHGALTVAPTATATRRKDIRVADRGVLGGALVASVDAATARRLGLGRDRALGTDRARLKADVRRTVAVKLSARATRRYPRTGRVRVTLAIRASGPSGQRAVTTRTISVPAT